MAGGKVREYQFNASGGISSVTFINTPSASSGSVAWGDITGTIASQTDISTMYALTSHVHSASDITSSTFALARMGGGIYNVSTFLDGTGTFVPITYSYISSRPTLGTAASTAASDYAVADHFHSASKVTSSTFALARLGGGTTNISTFLDGTGNFSQPSFSSLANIPTLGTAASTAAALYAASTHNVTSNAHSFPGGTANFLRADGTWAAPAGGTSPISTVRVTSVQFTTTTSSFALSALAFTVSNTVAQSFNFGIAFATAISTTGAAFGMTFPAVSTFAAKVYIPTSSVAAEKMGWLVTSGAAITSNSVLLASTKYMATIEGMIIPSANGTLQVTFATEVAGSAVSCYAGSYGILTTL